MLKNRAATNLVSSTDDELALLLDMREWRGRITAAWLIGLTQRTRFVERIGQLLQASELTYAGQGYCVAMGLIGGIPCEQHLRNYLKRYLPLINRIYDQEWAIGALTHILGSPPAEFLEPALWESGDMKLDPHDGISKFADLVDYLQKHRLAVANK